MNTSALVEWQRIDEENGLVEPWLTWPFMDWVKTLGLSDKIILEFGAGRSTAWWRKKSKWVDSIEANTEWALQAMKDCVESDLTNGAIYYKDINDGMAASGELDKYMNLIPSKQPYDIIIVDGIYRTEILEWAIAHLKVNGGGMLFIDNLDQDFVWISPRANELVAPLEGEIFIQPNHINHEGKPWNTRYYKVNQ